jgi:hypothetical protein
MTGSERLAEGESADFRRACPDEMNRDLIFGQRNGAEDQLFLRIFSFVLQYVVSIFGLCLSRCGLNFSTAGFNLQGNVRKGFGRLVNSVFGFDARHIGRRMNARAGCPQL